MNQQITDLAPELLDTTVDDEAAAPRFESAPVCGDQRQSYRYPAQQGREEATIRRRGRNFRGKLCEESAGGMALEVAQDLKLRENDQVEVGIYTGWYRARVVHVHPAEDNWRVGLQRISVISTEDDEEGRPRRRGAAGGAGQIRNLVAVAFVALALGVGVTSLFGGGFGKGEKPVKHAGISTHYADATADKQLKGVLESVNLLLEPEVADRLKLSKEQRDSIEGVMFGASNSLGEAYEESRDQPPEVWYAKSQTVVNEALENILCSMTDEQVMRWRAVMLHQREKRESE